MKKIKTEIIKTIDINEEYALIIVKKIKEKDKLCKDCIHLRDLGDTHLYYCDKHLGLVEPNDICIEVGM